jgi:hypothetical protein
MHATLASNPDVIITLTADEAKDFMEEGYSTHDSRIQPVTYAIYRQVRMATNYTPGDK